MALHRLTQITLGVPNVEKTAEYYMEFGLQSRKDEVVSVFDAVTLAPTGEHTLSTTDGGEQLKIVHSDRRRLMRLGVGVDNPDDLDRVAASLASIDVSTERTATSISATDPGTEVTVSIEIAPRYNQNPMPTPAYNSPGVVAREDQRAPGVLREDAVRPRKLGHVVLGSTNQEFSQTFFTTGLGFKISDTVPGLAAFMRCSTDHHNVLVQQAPVAFLHHTSWQLDDVDEIGRGATAMLAVDPARHVWGLGRHHIGSNFFWYLKDPAGNFSEYYSDLDCIVNDALWKPGIWEGAKGLYNWGPPPSPSFLAPDDLAALMTGAHSVA